ncbi:DUF6789 family protein [Halobacteriales archaeon Cl-PHB]
MRRPANAVAGGVAGTAVLSLLLLFLEVETREALGVFEAIARFVGMPGQLALGFVVFVAAGVLAWPLLFLAVADYIPKDDPAAAGLVFGLVLWIPFAVIGRGDLTGPGLFIYVSFTLLAHLAYGFVLGAVTVHLADPGEEATPTAGRQAGE